MGMPRLMLLVMGITGMLISGVATAADIKLGIMQPQLGDARKYQPMLEYLKENGVTASFVTAANYPAAANMFAKGQVDAMFSGSGVAGIMMMKELADPLVRPVTREGTSTYSAAIIAKKGGARFNGSSAYFAGKRVIVTPLASSGEIYLRSLGKVTAQTLMLAASHGAAIDAVNRGQADLAIVKNRVWDKEKSRYPELEQVGRDNTENPDNTLIVSRKLGKATAGKLASVMLGLESDSSAGASAVKDSLGISRFIKTTSAEFKGTLDLLKKSGVTRSFNFKY